MKNKLLAAVLILSSVGAYAQVTVAAKAHALFPAGKPTWESVKAGAIEAYEAEGKNNVGFNAGVSVKVNLVGGLFVMPELYYTTFTNEITEPVTNTTIEAKTNRADLPVLLGYNVLGESVGIFAGPVASYYLSKDNQYEDFRENAESNFTVGFQLGAQVKIKSFIISGRYEGSFTEDQRDFINSNSNTVIRYDNRPSMLMAGLGYQF